MDRVDERREEQRDGRSHHADPPQRARTNLERAGIRRIDANAEQQPADNRHNVEEHVAHVADAARDEPLQPFFERPDGDAGDERQHEHRDVTARPPDAVEEERDEAVFDEVDALDGVDFRIALGVPHRVSRAEEQGRHDRAVPQRSSIADPHQRDDERAADREGDGRRHDRRVLTRKRRADPVPDVADERRRQDHGARDDEGQGEP